MALASTICIFGGCKDPPTSSRYELDVKQSSLSVDDIQQPQLQTESSIATAERLFEEGRLDEADAHLRQHLMACPDDWDAMFLSATILAQQEQYAAAIEILDQFPEDDRRLWLASIGQAADWQVEAGNLEDAYDRFHRLLKHFPDEAIAQHRASELLYRQGRHQEMRNLLIKVCRNGGAEYHELLLLIDSSLGPDIDYSPAETAAYPLLTARRAYAGGHPHTVLEILRPAIQQRTATLAHKTFFGRVACELKDQPAIDLWISNITAPLDRFGDHWYSLGLLALDEKGQTEKEANRRATRLFAEALLRDPNHRQSTLRLASCIKKLGNLQQASALERRAWLIEQAINLGKRIKATSYPDSKTVEMIADKLEAAERGIEAANWRKLSLQMQGASRDDIDKADHSIAYHSHKKNPNRISLHALCGLNPLDYSLYFPSRMETAKQLRGKEFGPLPRPGIARFYDVAKSVGLDFQYLNAATRKERDFQVYEVMGASCCVIDYDGNGLPDVYFPQAASSHPDFISTQGNVLYSQSTRGAFEIQRNARVSELGYGLSATSGDLNQDGFPDLVVGNLHENQVFFNNGDGTFSPSRDCTFTNDPLWTSALAIADVTGDHLPELIEINYIHDPNIYDKIPIGVSGRPIEFKGPLDFTPAPDRLFKNQGDGSWQRQLMLMPTSVDQESQGLGIVVTDFDGKPGNEIFVSNDMRPNHYWQRKPSPEPNELPLEETGEILGCARSAYGTRFASMGIASGDFDRNGMIDIHVTNFFNEPVHVYLQQPSGLFTDGFARMGLDKESLGVLGFGCESLDFDNNGSLDLAVINGHIEDKEFQNQPFKMLPQLFVGGDDRFVLRSVRDDSGYWSRPAIGRGLVRLDWNRDGRMDLIANHLDVPVALLENRTETDYRWLQLELVGTESERDAIGARVEVTTANGTLVEAVTTGDGYSCRSEALLSFGLGNCENIDSIKVTWPSGRMQTFNASANRCFLLIEGRSSLVERTE